MTNYFSIAGIKIKLEGSLYDYVLYRLRDYAVNYIKVPDVTITYREEENIKIPECTLVKKDRFRMFCENEEEYVNYDILKENDYSALMRIKKDFKEINLYLKDVEDLGGASLSVRLFNMIGEVVKQLVIKNRGLSVHSSSISYKDNGIIFSAPSGTGKSTHTRLWQKNYEGTKIINDDMPVLRVIDGKFHLCGVPWSGKTERNINENVPLKAVVFLERGEKNEIEEISVAESVFLLLKQTTMPPYKELAKEVMNNVKNLVENIPFYRLKCTISDEAPKVVKDKLGI